MGEVLGDGAGRYGCENRYVGRGGKKKTISLSLRMIVFPSI